MTTPNHLRLAAVPKGRFSKSLERPFGTADKRGFTLAEFTVVLAILLILIGIFFPYVTTIRESDRRARCFDNLHQIFSGLSEYAHSNRGEFPRVRTRPVEAPPGYTCFTGVDEASPFSSTSLVSPNDVSASLWLLVRQHLVSPKDFICPGTADVADSMNNSTGVAVSPAQRGNFRSLQNLSYSYASPFSTIPAYHLNDTQRSDFVLLGDRNPGVDGPQIDVTGPGVAATPWKMSVANSHNHGRAGQNVLFADGHVSFVSTPYCGVERDNIFTALGPSRSGKPPSTAPTGDALLSPRSANGVVGMNQEPAWASDSYLVPTESDIH